MSQHAWVLRISAFYIPRESVTQDTKGTYDSPVMRTIHAPVKTNAANAQMKRLMQSELWQYS